MLSLSAFLVVFIVAGASSYSWPRHSASVMFNMRREGTSWGEMQRSEATAAATTTATSTASETTTATSTASSTSTSDASTDQTTENPEWTEQQPVSEPSYNPVGEAHTSTTATSETTDVGSHAYICQNPPLHYVRRGDYYYHLESEVEMTYVEAKESCRMYGAHLAYFKTAEEYSNMHNFILNTGLTSFYIGLEVPSGKVECSGALCDGKLFWSDGTALETAYLATRGISINNLDRVTTCTVMMSDGAVMDPEGGCELKLAFLCQMDCQGQIANEDGVASV